MHTAPTAKDSSEYSELASIASEAWTFGLPMVEHFKLFSLYRAEFSPVYREWNEFFHVRNLMTPEMQSVVSPNTDTLMSLVLFDGLDHSIEVFVCHLFKHHFFAVGQVIVNGTLIGRAGG